MFPTLHISPFAHEEFVISTEPRSITRLALYYRPFTRPASAVVAVARHKRRSEILHSLHPVGWWQYEVNGENMRVWHVRLQFDFTTICCFVKGYQNDIE